jgi:hypothetical protein
MSAYSKTVSVTQYKIIGVVKDVLNDVAEALRCAGFRGFVGGTDEAATGWVDLDDYSSTDFDNIKRDHLIAFSYRKDTRKVPGPVLKLHMENGKRAFLKENPTYQRVPRSIQAEMKEKILGELLPKVFPTMKSIDILWDTRTNILTAYSTSLSQLDDFTELFRQTFKEMKLQITIVHTAGRARMLLPATDRKKLDEMITGETASALIENNEWLGRDFLDWLFCRTIEGNSTFKVGVDGPAALEEELTAYIDDKLVLCGEGNQGQQKVSISGPQDKFSEVIDALRQGKHMEEATVYLERGDEMWRLTLKGKTFQFASVRKPTILLDGADSDDERNAMLFEGSEVLRMGLQLFDSVFLEFLKLRVSNEWDSECKKQQVAIAA